MTQVIGHTELTDEQKLIANVVKERINDLGALLDDLASSGEHDLRSLNVARTHLQTASMWASRAIFQPSSFA